MSPLLGIGSWIQVLLEVDESYDLSQFLDCFDSTERERFRDEGNGPADGDRDYCHDGEAADEPQPQTQDSLISYWQSKSLLTQAVHHRTEESTATSRHSPSRRPASQATANHGRRLPSLQHSRASTSLGGTRRATPGATSNTSDVLAQESIIARRGLQAARADRTFWSNRLKMLHRELERAQSRVDHMRSSSSRFQVSKIANESIAAQLAEERRRDAQMRQERAEHIRASQEAHKRAVRQAHQQIIQDKLERGRLSKIHQRNHQSIVEAMRREEFAEKCRKREKIQQAKVVALLKRVRERAMRDEEIRQSYQMRIQHTHDEERDDSRTTLRLVQESSKLVEKIRKLREVEQIATASGLALRSLDTQLYQ